MRSANDEQGQLRHDSRWLLGRRQVLAGLGTSALAASSVRLPAQARTCFATPTETRGPFPADGTNGNPPLNVLSSPGLVRRDLRGSFGNMTGRADGAPLSLSLALMGGPACAPLPGAALYLWQNDAAGDYSLYNRADVNYLRGMQAADAAGRAEFTLIVPGCYGGRYPHCHFEVYASIAAAARGERPLLVSQLAFPAEACRALYATDRRYGQSLANLDRLPIERDFVFGDADSAGRARQTIALTGGPQGYAGAATIAIA